MKKHGFKRISKNGIWRWKGSLYKVAKGSSGYNLVRLQTESRKRNKQASNANKKVYVDKEGYAHDELGSEWFVWREYSEETYNSSDELPRPDMSRSDTKLIKPSMRRVRRTV